MQDYRTIQGRRPPSWKKSAAALLPGRLFAGGGRGGAGVLETVRAANRTASHNVYAYVLREGARARYSDDGEPAKTAGLPVLGSHSARGPYRLRRGGDPLFWGHAAGHRGPGARLHQSAARALAATRVVTVRACVTLSLELEYSLYEPAVLLLQNAGAKLAEPEFGQLVPCAPPCPPGPRRRCCRLCRADPRRGASGFAPFTRLFDLCRRASPPLPGPARQNL